MFHINSLLDAFNDFDALKSCRECRRDGNCKSFGAGSVGECINELWDAVDKIRRTGEAVDGEERAVLYNYLTTFNRFHLDDAEMHSATTASPIRDRFSIAYQSFPGHPEIAMMTVMKELQRLLVELTRISGLLTGYWWY